MNNQIQESGKQNSGPPKGKSLLIVVLKLSRWFRSEVWLSIGIALLFIILLALFLLLFWVKLPSCQPASRSDEGYAPSIFVSGDLYWSEEARHTWGMQGESCQLEWVGRVCGFGVMQSDVPDAPEAPTKECKDFENPKDAELLRQSLCEVGKQLKAWGEKGQLKALVLLGRADRRPFSDAEYGGNRGLAEARARTVWEKFRKYPHLPEVLDRRTMLIGTGPLNVPRPEKITGPNDDQMRRADRGVDVFACLVPGDATDAKNQLGNIKTSKECGGPAGLLGRVENTAGLPGNVGPFVTVAQGLQGGR